MLVALILLTALSGSHSAPIIQSTGTPSQLPPFFGHLPNCLWIVRSPELLWCLTTIFACTWVVVHPDIPRPTDSGWMRLRRQTSILLYGLLAPELVMYWAWKQRDAAKQAMKEYNAQCHADIPVVERSWFRHILNDIKEWFDGPDPRKPEVWTLTHGFFVNMGGYVLFDDETPLHTLNFNTLKELIKEGRIDAPDTSEAEIRDRSKGDLLTKLLFLQAAWFIGRCVSKPQTTQMDIITLAIVIVNAITYLLWWDKPQNIRVSIRVPLKEVDPEVYGEKKGTEF